MNNAITSKNILKKVVAMKRESAMFVSSVRDGSLLKEESNQTPDKSVTLSFIMAKKISSSSVSVPSILEGFLSHENSVKTMNFVFDGIPSTIHHHTGSGGTMTILLDTIPLNEGEEPVLCYPSEERRGKIMKILEENNLL